MTKKQRVRTEAEAQTRIAANLVRDAIEKVAKPKLTLWQKLKKYMSSGTMSQ